MMTQFGGLVNCKLICSKNSFLFCVRYSVIYLAGANLGYGFVEYSTPEQALAAIRCLNGKMFDGKILKVSYARNPSPKIKNANMYISGLHPAVDRDVLYKLFEPYGTIITHNILKGEYFFLLHVLYLLDAVGRSRCAGFVRMSQHSQALNAINNLNGKSYLGKTLNVKLGY
jgi:polyadenylate-binding protein